MLSESFDVIEIDTTGHQTTPRYVASLLIGFLMWTGENDKFGRKSFRKRSTFDTLGSLRRYYGDAEDNVD